MMHLHLLDESESKIEEDQGWLTSIFMKVKGKMEEDQGRSISIFLMRGGSRLIHLHLLDESESKIEEDRRWFISVFSTWVACGPCKIRQRKTKDDSSRSGITSARLLPNFHVMRSYRGYYTRSHQNSAVKRLWAGIVLGWVTSREVPVLHPFYFPFWTLPPTKPCSLITCLSTTQFLHPTPPQPYF